MNIPYKNNLKIDKSGLIAELWILWTDGKLFTYFIWVIMNSYYKMQKNKANKNSFFLWILKGEGKEYKKKKGKGKAKMKMKRKKKMKMKRKMRCCCWRCCLAAAKYIIARECIATLRRRRQRSIFFLRIDSALQEGILWKSHFFSAKIWRVLISAVSLQRGKGEACRSITCYWDSRHSAAMVASLGGRRCATRRQWMRHSAAMDAPLGGNGSGAAW